MLRISLFFCLAIVGAGQVAGQSACQLVPQTIWEPKPVTAYRWVQETQFETRQITENKPVWVTETRERRTTVLKPVQKQRILEETYEVLKPVVETDYREQQIQETEYEVTTELQTQQVLVEKPIVETRYREEHVVVRKPITQTVLQAENVVAYRPVTTNQTVLVPGNVAVSQTASQPFFANRLQWLSPGYYVDPVTGFTVYRRPGFHWVPNPPLVQTVMQPTLVPQQTTQTSYVPELVQQQKPVEMTTYQDQIETRRIPYQVQTNQQVYETRQVPVEVRKPVVRTRVEKVPVETTRYVKQEVVRRTPIIETTYEQVEQVEPYQVQVQKWVSETSSIQVPKQVWKRIEYPTTQLVPRTVMHFVPVDAFGNLLYSPPPSIVMGTSSTTGSLPQTSAIVQGETTTVAKPVSVLENPREIQGQWQTLKKPSSLTGDEIDLNNSVLKKSVIIDDPNAANVPEKTGETDGNSPELKPIEKPTTPDAADQPPELK